MGGGDMSISGVAFDSVWRAQFSASCVLIPLAVLVALVALATLYPAAKAARLNPVQAIHHT
jgi:ABC-type antimicrobial peptide transport system permease subunit